MAEVAAEVESSVVQVNVQAIQTTPFGEQQEAEGLGSGVIYREDGYIITNNHVIEGAEEVNVAFADGTVEQAGINPFSRTVPIVDFSTSGHIVPRILPGVDTRSWRE